MNKFFLGLFIVFLLVPSLAAGQTRLTSAQIERLKASRQLLADVDDRSLEAGLAGLERSDFPEENLQILEAIARTYADIVKEQNVIEQKNKEWLYSMITLNAAYLQLGGIQAGQSGDTALNKLIRAKLKKYLSPELQQNQEIFKPLF